MRCPTLTELPPPPPGKTGWPWTEESPQLPDTMPNPSVPFRAQAGSGQVGFPWPRISIVTPSFNQGQFIEETIRSVLLQGYPNLEYIIIDGSSTDGSVEIIKKYKPWLAYWESEPDRGQSHAINKGWGRITGEITTWLNSDDIYLKNTLALVASAYHSQQEKKVLFGDGIVINEAGKFVEVFNSYCSNPLDLIAYWKNWGRTCWLLQPATFYPVALLNQIGHLDEELFWAMDYDLWIRLSQHWKFHHIAVPLAGARLLTNSKTQAGGAAMWKQTAEVGQRYWGSKLSISYYYFASSYLYWRLWNQCKDQYALAAESWRKGDRRRALLRFLYSVILLPTSLFKRNRLSLLSRILFGNQITTSLKDEG